MTARNRVWTARRRLPLLLQPIYLVVWTLLMLARAPSATARRQTLDGLREGITTPPPPPVDRMSWRTVVHMTRLGRPPVI